MMTHKTKLLGCLKDAITNYFECSGVHGVRYIGENTRPWFERTLWMVMLLASLATSSTLILGVWRRWVDSPVLVTFAEKPIRIWDIPFPTVTMCSSNKYRREIFNFERARNLNRSLLTPQARKVLDDISLLCRGVSSSLSYDDGNFPRFTNESIIDIFRQVTPPFLSSTMQCFTVSNMPDICKNSVQYIFTKDGVCASFNLLPPSLLFKPSAVQHSQGLNISIHDIWSLEAGYSKHSSARDLPLRASGTGFNRGMIFVLHMNKLDQDYFCQLIQGYRVSLTVPSDVPRMDEYFLLRPNGLTLMAIQSHMMDTSESLRGYTPEKRGCFFPSERQLAYFTTYSKDNCDLECLTNYTLHSCNCVEYYMPRNSSTRICGIGSTNCVIRAEENLHKEEVDEQVRNVKSDITCNCLPSCVSLHFTAEVTQAELHLEMVAEGNIENISMNMLYIYYRRSEFIGSQRGELYTIVDFIANCGGLLGLCCGITALSFVELFYHLTIRLWNNLYQKTKRP